MIARASQRKRKEEGEGRRWQRERRDRESEGEEGKRREEMEKRERKGEQERNGSTVSLSLVACFPAGRAMALLLRRTTHRCLEHTIPSLLRHDCLRLPLFGPSLLVEDWLAGRQAP